MRLSLIASAILVASGTPVVVSAKTPPPQPAAPVILKNCSIEGPRGLFYALYKKEPGSNAKYTYAAKIDIPGKVNSSYPYHGGTRPVITAEVETAGQSNAPGLGGVYFRSMDAYLPYLYGRPKYSEIRYMVLQNGKPLPLNKRFSVGKPVSGFYLDSEKNYVTVNISPNSFDPADPSNLFHRPKAVLATLNTEIRVMHFDAVVSTIEFKGTDVIASANLVEKNWLALIAAADAKKCVPRGRYEGVFSG